MGKSILVGHDPNLSFGQRPTISKGQKESLGKGSPNRFQPEETDSDRWLSSVAVRGFQRIPGTHLRKAHVLPVEPLTPPPPRPDSVAATTPLPKAFNFLWVHWRTLPLPKT